MPALSPYNKVIPYHLSGTTAHCRVGFGDENESQLPASQSSSEMHNNKISEHRTATTIGVTVASYARCLQAASISIFGF
jgi:hypothetical protein